MSRAALVLGEPSDNTSGGDGGNGDESSREADVPLTVAAVAARLGVAPSTLRTWDRRYGLGPSGRSAGSHRRYTPEDVARLETMRRLTLAGAAPSDAARVAAAGKASAGLASVPSPVARGRVDGLTLAAAAVDGAEARVRGMLAAVAATDVVGAWVEIAQPAFDFLAKRETGDRPGRDPEVFLAACVLALAREVVDAAEPGPEGAARPRVVMVADSRRLAERVGAHVLAAALTQRRLDVRVLGATAADVGVVARLLDTAAPTAVCVIGESSRAEELARWASDRGRPPVFLIGQPSADVWLPGVLHVRTLPGAVHEIVALLGSPGTLSQRAEGPA